MNVFLYLLVILIWGTTWIAIRWQLGEVPVTVSVFYRMALAGALLFPVLFLSGKLQKTTWRDQGFFVLQGICLFSINYILSYAATEYLVSGLVSVVFSMATLFNAVNNRLIWKEKPGARFIISALLGLMGLILLFWRDLQGSDWSPSIGLGIALVASGTYVFSLGNMVSLRNSRVGLSPLTSIAYALIYATVVLLLIIVAMDLPLVIEWTPLYLGSLLYLVIPGTLIAFMAYLALVERMGANRAAYATVAFPVVALLISSVFENYVWHWTSVMGMGLVLLGNLVMQGSAGRLLRGMRKRQARLNAIHNP